MAWITDLPVGVLYFALSLGGFVILGTIGLSAITLIKGGKVKAGPVELDTEEEEEEKKNA